MGLRSGLTASEKERSGISTTYSLAQAKDMIKGVADTIQKDPMCVTVDGALAQLGLGRSRWVKAMSEWREDDEVREAAEILDQILVDRLTRLGMDKKNVSDRMALAILNNRHGFENVSDDGNKMPQIVINVGDDAAKRFVQAKDKNDLAWKTEATDARVVELPALPAAPDHGGKGVFRELQTMDDLGSNGEGRLSGNKKAAAKATAEELLFIP